MSSYEKVSLSGSINLLRLQITIILAKSKSILRTWCTCGSWLHGSGNWITSVVGGASYKYSLLFVILISSIIAMQLQQMAGKLGIVTRMDPSAGNSSSCSQVASLWFVGDFRVGF